MSNSVKRAVAVAAASSAFLLCAGPSARAQINPYFQVRPGVTIGQYAYNTALMGQALSQFPPWFFGPRYANLLAGNAGFPGANAAAMYSSSPYNAYLSSGAGYGGYNPYNSLYSSPYYPYGYDPASSYLMGGADVINSQGRLMVNQQQAFLMREQVHSARIDNRRKAFDEYLYERERTPTPEEERQFFARQQGIRSRNDPPVTEVYSGKSLNDLLADLRKQGKNDSPALRTFALPLDEDALKHINVTSGGGAGNVALLKNSGRLSWPLALSSNEFRDEREQFNSLIQEAVKQAEFNNQVDAGTLRQLSDQLNLVRRHVRRVSGELSFDQARDANTFLNNLDDAVKGLGQRDVGSHFTGKYVIKAKTIPDLVKFMTEQGLVFAPAVPGDEAAYVALQRALASYDQVTQLQGTPQK
jgi:hypothetical protein